MEAKLAIPIILLSALVGITLGIGEMQKIDSEWLENTEDTNQNKNVTHEHALFFVVTNDTELSFLEQKYQLEARHVHLENNKSHIVHKHREGVTWREFLRTVDAELEHKNNTTYCGSFKNMSYCGEAAVQLNGENVSSLDREIQQGDKFIVVLQPEVEEWLEKYESYELPPAYKERKITGREI